MPHLSCRVTAAILADEIAACTADIASETPPTLTLNENQHEQSVVLPQFELMSCSCRVISTSRASGVMSADAGWNPFLPIRMRS
jgi:hypothetical protein